MASYVNLSMRPDAVNMHVPLLPHGARDAKMNPADNESPSVTNPYKRAPVTSEEIQEEKRGLLQIKGAENVVEFSERRLDAISDHMEERLQAFFMQIVGCYGTEYVFKEGVTEIQLDSSFKINFVVAAGVHFPFSLTMKRASAHHGTLPCIYAYPREAYRLWERNHNNPKPEPQNYLKNSDTYYLSNACTGLEVEDNVADIDIDGKSSAVDGKLRDFTIQLLNQAAEGQIDPIQGMGLFIAKLKNLVDVLAKASHDRREIHRIWQRDLTRLHDEFTEETITFIARLLGIPNEGIDEQALRAHIFPRHFKIIQTKDLYQSQIEARIEQLREKILKGHHRPNTFDKALKWAILKESNNRDPAISKIFKRYFNSSGQMLQNLENDCYNPAKALVSTPKSQKYISEFFDEVEDLVHNFEIEECRFSAGVLKQMRLIQGYSLRSFSSAFNAVFPHAFPNGHELTYGQLDRIERGNVKITPERAAQFAKILGVHKSILWPELCALSHDE